MVYEWTKPILLLCYSYSQVTLLFDLACMDFAVQLCFWGRADGCHPESVPVEKQLPEPFDVTAEFLYFFILAVATMVVGLRNYF